MISRLDEDLSTLGQISKLSETLSFPHQVIQTNMVSVPFPSYLLNLIIVIFIIISWSFPSDSVPWWGHKRPAGIDTQGTVRETVPGLQHKLLAHKAGVYNSLSREQLCLWVHFSRRPFQLWACIWRGQEEVGSVHELALLLLLQLLWLTLL